MASDSPARLLFYTHALTGGGAERVWALLASGFARRGDEVVFAVDKAARANIGFLDPAVRLVVLEGGHLASTLRLARLMLREKPDAMLAALSVSNLKMMIAAMLVGRWRRTILSYHGYGASEPQLLSQIGFRLTPVLTRLAARTVCVSDGLRAYLLRRWGASPARTVRIYNPVLGGPGQPAQNGAALMARGPNVLASARLIDYKNFPLLVDAFAKVRDPSAQLFILGEGDDKRLILERIARHGLEGRVHLLGYIDAPWTVYESARVFAMSSNFETFGLVLVEAMANGLAVVSTDCEGPREILRNGALGALTPIGDATALCAAIEAALADPGDPAPRIARAQDFSVDVGVKAYGMVIAQVIAAHRQARAEHSPAA